MAQDSVALFVINFAMISIHFLFTCTCILNLYICKLSGYLQIFRHQNNVTVHKKNCTPGNKKILTSQIQNLWCYRYSLSIHATKKYTPGNRKAPKLSQILDLWFYRYSVSMQFFMSGLVRNCFSFFFLFFILVVCAVLMWFCPLLHFDMSIDYESNQGVLSGDWDIKSQTSFDTQLVVIVNELSCFQ